MPSTTRVLIVLCIASFTLALTAATALAVQGDKVTVRPGAPAGDTGEYYVKWTWQADFCNWSNEIDATWEWTLGVTPLRPVPGDWFQVGSSDLMTGYDTWTLPPGLYAQDNSLGCTSSLPSCADEEDSCALVGGNHLPVKTADPKTFIVGNCYAKVSYQSGTATVERTQPPVVENGTLTYPSAEQALAKGGYVLPGETVRVGAGGTLELEFPDGSVRRIGSGGVASITNDSCTSESRPFSAKLFLGSVWSKVSGLLGQPEVTEITDNVGSPRGDHRRAATKLVTHARVVARRGAWYKVTSTRRSGRIVAVVRVWKGSVTLASVKGTRASITLTAGQAARFAQGSRPTRLARFDPKRVRFYG